MTDVEVERETLGARRATLQARTQRHSVEAGACLLAGAFFLFGCGGSAVVEDTAGEDDDGSPSSQESIDPTEPEICAAADGAWAHSHDGCVDQCCVDPSCLEACAAASSSGCDCGPSRCWNGSDCVPGPSVKDP